MELQYLILAGGRGERLMPLTENMPKPLVRFGSGGAIIDYTLYNCLETNGGNALVLTQYCSDMVERYLGVYWTHSFVSAGSKVETLAGESSEKVEFSGTADAVFQALLSMKKLPETVVVLAADHVYRVNYRSLIEFHRGHGKAGTIGTVPCDPSEVHRFGIMKVNEKGGVESFIEKPRDLECAGAGDNPLASMGIYVFNTRKLMRYLEENQEEASQDFGKDVLPRMIKDREVNAFDFKDGKGQAPYWRDVGDLHSYWQAQMDMLDMKREVLKSSPLPGKGRLPFTRKEFVDKLDDRERRVSRSAIASTAQVGNAIIEHSVIGPGATVRDGSVIRNSVLLDGAYVHRGTEVGDRVLIPMAEVNPDAPGGIHGKGEALFVGGLKAS